MRFVRFRAKREVDALMSPRLAGLGCVVALMLLVVGCSGSGGDGSGDDAGSGEQPRSEQPGSFESTDVTDERESGAGSERVLPDEWYVDSDDNYVPDFVERDLGYDPEADDCAKRVDCPGPSGTSAMDLASQEQNTLLILDSSGSMAEPIDGRQTKMNAAKAALERYATGTPDFINLGFMVYGHEGSNTEADRAESCGSTEVLEQLGEVDYRTFPGTLETFQPSGWTPVAGALEEAGNAFSGKEEATNRVILVSDGLETCGGDPVAAAEELADSDIEVTIDVVGFDIPRSEEAQLRQIAEVSGGRYATVRSADELQDYFDQQQRVFWQLFDQFYCLNSHGIEVFNCSNEFDIDVNNRMQELLHSVEGEEWDAMYEIKTRADKHLDETRIRANEASQERKDEIQQDMEEVRDRMQRRYKEEVSFTPACPMPPIYADFEDDSAPDPELLALFSPILEATGKSGA